MKGRPLIYVLAVGAVVLAGGLAVRFRPQLFFASATISGLPAVPDLGRWPQEMQERVANLTKAAADPKESVTALGELAQLYFSNGFSVEATQTLQILIKADAANARWTYLLGYLEERAEHREIALGLYASAARLAPAYSPALIRQANLLALSGQSDAARQLFEQCLTLSPPDPRALYGLAKLDLARDGEPAAIERLNRIVKQFPDFQDAHGMLAELLAKAGKTEEAAEQRAFMSQGQGSAPDFDPYVDETYLHCYNTHRLQVLGEFRNAVHAYEAARLYLERAVQIDPKDPEIQDALARCYIGLNRWSDAQTKLQQALQIAGPSDLLYFRLSEVLLAQNKGGEAVAVLLDADKKVPNSATIKDALGLAYMSLERIPEAIEAFKVAVQLDPVIPGTQFNLARCYLKSGNPQLARSWAERALKIRPEIPDGLALLTASALQLGEIEVATQSAQDLLRASNNAPEHRSLITATLLRAGNLAAERGDHNRAEKLYRDGLSVNEKDGQLHGALGMLFGKLRRYNEAKSEFEAFQQLDPRNPLAYLLLGAALEAANKPEEARQTWKAGLNIALETQDSIRISQLRKHLEKP